MKITTDTPNLLVLRFTRWKSPLLYAWLSFCSIWVAVRIIVDTNMGFGALLVWLLLTLTWMAPMMLFRAERSMLVLDATTGEAELRHRDIKGLHRHTWPLGEVQSTRVTRRNRHRPAIDGPKRTLTLYVRDGMDEGRHKLTNHSIPADDALAASARVSDWMKDWRASLDLKRPQA